MNKVYCIIPFSSVPGDSKGPHREFARYREVSLYLTRGTEFGENAVQQLKLAGGTDGFQSIFGHVGLRAQEEVGVVTGLPQMHGSVL